MPEVCNTHHLVKCCRSNSIIACPGPPSVINITHAKCACAIFLLYSMEIHLVFLHGCISTVCNYHMLIDVTA